MSKLTFNSFEKDSDHTVVRFDCDFTVETAGDGLWGCEAGRQVQVTGISVVTKALDDDRIYVMINVAHNSTWDIYTDNGFSDAISEALGYDVDFTEQGMQENGMASMEC